MGVYISDLHKMRKIKKILWKTTLNSTLSKANVDLQESFLATVTKDSGGVLRVAQNNPAENI